MTTDQAPRRLGPQFVAETRERFAHRRPQERPLTYDIAVDEEYEPWRVWIDEQLTHLSEEVAAVYARSIWQDEHFWPRLVELAAAEAVRAAGFTVEYERRWGQVTPDWTVLGADGQPVALIEVLVDSLPNNTVGRIRAWHGLVERIKQIPVPVVLALAGGPDGPLRVPNARTAKQIAKELRDWLLSPLVGSAFTTCGYTFLVQADPRSGRTMRPPGMRAIFIPPSSRSGLVTAQPLATRIEGKTRKYRSVASEAGLPLIVAAGAHRYTGLGIAQLDELLAGQPTLTFQFGFGDTHIGDSVQFEPFNPPKWTMPKELAGVLWVDNTFPFTISWRPNHDALVPAPPLLTRQWAG